MPVSVNHDSGLAITIGIPFAWAHLKSSRRFRLWRIGKAIVSSEDAARLGIGVGLRLDLRLAAIPGEWVGSCFLPAVE